MNSLLGKGLVLAQNFNLEYLRALFPLLIPPFLLVFHLALLFDPG